MVTVKELIGKHKGKLGFAIGSGPSLRYLDPSDIYPFVSIAVNSALSKMRKADYFLADDIGVKHWNYYQEILPTLDCTSLLYHGKLKTEANHLNPDRICWFTHKTWYQPSNNRYYEDGLVMTSDESPIIGARTAVGSAVHFLHIMGCDPIVLLGCDCCYEGMKRYYWQFKGEEECFRLNGEKVFSFPNAGVKDGKPLDSHSKDFLKYWEALYKQSKKQGINIISASGGLLNIFPQMTFRGVLEQYGDRKK